MSATLATGDAVNTAKRLEEAAGGGEILIGAVTERLVRHASRLDAVTPVEAKGKSAPVEAWRVLERHRRCRLVRPSLGHASRRQDGRARCCSGTELTASADRRECRLVTVIGAAGVGKTRLVSEFVAEVGAYAHRRLRAAASPTATGSPSGR